MTSQREKKIKVKAALENLEKLVNFVISCARELGIAEEKVSDLHLAVDEACTNIINYAYPRGAAGEVEVTCALDGDTFLITLTDRGKPFDPTRNPPPDLELDLDQRPIGGLGIYLMKKFSDGLTYTRRGRVNRLEILKKV